MPSAWPASLPQYVDQGGYTETPPAVALRSDMDAGAAKVRRRFTDAPRFFSISVQIDDTQRATLDTFYVTTLVGGTLSFDWVHPITRASAEFRFMSPPTYVALSGLVFRATLPLELLP